MVVILCVGMGVLAVEFGVVDVAVVGKDAQFLLCHGHISPALTNIVADLGQIGFPESEFRSGASFCFCPEE
jgi:hypothetical protein